jgi:hypothetical protein
MYSKKKKKKSEVHIEYKWEYIEYEFDKKRSHFDQKRSTSLKAGVYLPLIGCHSLSANSAFFIIY